MNGRFFSDGCWDERASTSKAAGELLAISGASIAVCTFRRASTFRRVSFFRDRSPPLGTSIGWGFEGDCWVLDVVRGAGKARSGPVTAGSRPLEVAISSISISVGCDE